MIGSDQDRRPTSSDNVNPGMLARKTASVLYFLNIFLMGSMKFQLVIIFEPSFSEPVGCMQEQ